MAIKIDTHEDLVSYIIKLIEKSNVSLETDDDVMYILKDLLDGLGIDNKDQYFIFLKALEDKKEEIMESDVEGSDELDGFLEEGEKGQGSVDEEDSDNSDLDDDDEDDEDDEDKEEEILEEDIEYTPDELEIHPGEANYEEYMKMQKKKDKSTNDDDEEDVDEPSVKQLSKFKRKGFKSKKSDNKILTEREQIDEQQGTRGALTPKKAMGGIHKKQKKR